MSDGKTDTIGSKEKKQKQMSTLNVRFFFLKKVFYFYKCFSKNRNDITKNTVSCSPSFELKEKIF